MKWTTRDELKFLRKLGTWTATPKDRNELLERYKNSMALRRDWAGLNVDDIRKYVEGRNGNIRSSFSEKDLMRSLKGGQDDR